MKMINCQREADMVYFRECINQIDKSFDGDMGKFVISKQICQSAIDNMQKLEKLEKVIKDCEECKHESGHKCFTCLREQLIRVKEIMKGAEKD